MYSILSIHIQQGVECIQSLYSNHFGPFKGIDRNWNNMQIYLSCKSSKEGQRTLFTLAFGRTSIKHLFLGILEHNSSEYTKAHDENKARHWAIRSTKKSFFIKYQFCCNLMLMNLAFYPFYHCQFSLSC